MPTIFFKGDISDEQAIGNTLNSGFMKAYAVRRDQPTSLIFLGGHRIDDAPSYTISEAKIDPEYRHLNGRNILVEKTLVNDYVKSIVFNLQLPNKLISVTDRLYQIQDNFDYDLVLMPSTCEDGCEAFFWVGDDLTLGTRQITSAPIGFDENENPITSMRTARTAGQLASYYGLELMQLTARAGDVFGADIIYDPCDIGGCPYQKLVVVGENGDAAYSEDGGETWTTITTTTVTTDLVGADFTYVKYSNGNYVLAYSDVNDAVGTDGGLAYSVNGAAAVLSTILDTDGVTPFVSQGVQAIERAFNKLFAGGTDGELFYSCDDGVTWILITVPAALAAVTILSMAYDSTNSLLYIGAEDGVAFVYNGKSFVDITTEVGAPNTVDFLTVQVTAPGHVGFGGSNGTLYQNFTADDLTSAYSADVVSTAALYGFVSDGNRTYRSLVASGANVYLRDMLNEQVFTLKETITADTVLFGKAGYALKDEGANYFLFTTASGAIFVLASCNLCLENDCA